MALSHSAPEEHCHKSTVKYHHCEPVGDQYTSLEWRHLWWCERLFLQLVSRSHLCQQCCVLHGFLNSMHFSPKKSLTAVELQGLPSLILQTTGNHGGLLNDNTNCSSYPCHQYTPRYLWHPTGIFLHPPTLICTQERHHPFTCWYCGHSTQMPTCFI